MASIASLNAQLDVLEAQLRPATPPAVTGSPDGTRGARIVDATGVEWTFGPNGRTLRNGADAGGNGRIYLCWGGKAYVQAFTNNWYLWSGSWVDVGADPSIPPPPPPVQPAAFALNLPEVLDVRVGQTLNLAPFANRSAKWTMDAVPNAALSENGVLRGLAVGTVEVNIVADDGA